MQVGIGSFAFNVSTNASQTHYIGPYGELNDTTESGMDVWRFPFNARLGDMRCDVNTAPSAGQSWTITVRDDLVNTALACTISGTATGCTDTDFVSVVAGSIMTQEWLETGTTVATGDHGCSLSLIAN